MTFSSKTSTKPGKNAQKQLHTAYLLRSLAVVLLTTSPPLGELPLALLHLALKLSHLLQARLLFLGGLLVRLNLLAGVFALELLGAALCNVAGAEVAKQGLENDLDEPADDKVQGHDNGHLELELLRERHELNLGVDVRHDFHGAGKGETRDTDDAVEHGLVLGEGFTEGAALVVDGKSRNLLNQLEQIDGRVEQRRLEIGFKVDNVGATVA